MSRDDEKLHGSASDGVRRRRGGTFALTLVAMQLGLMFVGALMPTPLYPLYRLAFGFSGIVLTLIFAVYVLGNLLSLLLLGRVADQIGRRNASLPAIGFGLASATVFAAAAGTSCLFASRLLSGLATGLAAGAATAWIAELYSGRTEGGAARIASAANFFGCAAGPLLAGLLAQFAFWPLQLSFLVYLVLLCIIAGGLFLVPETVGHRRGLAHLALKPRIGVPPHIRLQFVAPAVTGLRHFRADRLLWSAAPQSAREQFAPVRPGNSGRRRLRAVPGRRADHPFHRPPAKPSRYDVRARPASAEPVVSGRRAAGAVDADPPLGHRARRHFRRLRLPWQPRNSLPVIGIGVLSAATDSLIAHIVFAALTTILAGLAALTGVKYAPKE